MNSIVDSERIKDKLRIKTKNKIRDRSRSIGIRTANLPGDDYDYSDNINSEIITTSQEGDLDHSSDDQLR